MKVKWELIIILLIVGFLLRLFITNCYWWDELVYLQHSEILSGKINNYNEFDFRPPLLSVLISGLYLLWHNPLIANIFVSLLATFSILLIYLITKEIFDKKIGLIAAFLLTFWPIHLAFSKSLLVHTTAMFFGLLFLFTLKKAEKTKKSWLFFLAGFFISLAILTRFTYLTLIPLVLFNICLFRERYGLKSLFYVFIGFLLPTAPYLIWANFTYGDPFHTFKTASLVVSWSTKQPWDFYFTNSWIFLGLGGIIGLVSWLFFSIKNKKITKQEIFLLAWFLMPLIYLTSMAHKEIRFLIIALTPVVILSAIGLKNLIDKIKNKKIILIIFLLIIIVSLFSSSYSPYSRICDSDIEKTAEWIMENTNKEDIIYAQDEFTALAYYTNRTIILAPFNKDIFFNETESSMKKPGYYIYFEKQKDVESFPKIEELEKDSRFELLKEFGQEGNKIFIYKYSPFN